MQQISVPLPDDVLAFVQQSAERECRTVAGQVRNLVSEAMRRAAGNGHAAAAPGLEPWPPPLPVVNRETLPQVKVQLDEWRAELMRLEAAEQRSRTGLRPDHEVRMRWLRNTIESVRSHVRVIEGKPA